MLTNEANSVLDNDRPRPMYASIERAEEELIALSPLSQSHPFVIIGISFERGESDLVEIESEQGLSNKKVVINRSIEFLAEHHSAGLGILNYFGTVLREKYPEQNAKVKIEQDG